MTMQIKIISLLVAIAVVSSGQAIVADVAAAQQGAAQQGVDRRDGPRPRGTDWADRIRNTTPEMREAQRKRALERLAEASPAERQRIMRRHRRMMRFLPEEERRKIRHERQEFAEKYGLDTSGRREGWNSMRAFEFTPEERRIVRGRVHQLSKEKRRELREKVLRMRELPQAERELLRERLHELKALNDEEKREFRQRARRWSRMSEEERETMRSLMQRIRSLSPADRQNLLQQAQNLAEPNNTPN